MKMKQNELAEYVFQIQKNDMSGFDTLYEKTKKIIFFNIFGYLNNKENSEDILQETYLNFLEHIEKINPKHSILGYLLTTSKNLSLNFIKVRRRERSLTDEEEVSMYSNEKNALNEDELINKMQKILKPSEFEIVYLKVVEDYSHKEIAAIFHKPIGTITWAYNNAIKKLEKGLGKEYGQN